MTYNALDQAIIKKIQEEGGRKAILKKVLNKVGETAAPVAKAVLGAVTLPSRVAGAAIKGAVSGVKSEFFSKPATPAPSPAKPYMPQMRAATPAESRSRPTPAGNPNGMPSQAKGVPALGNPTKPLKKMKPAMPKMPKDSLRKFKQKSYDRKRGQKFLAMREEMDRASEGP